MKETKRGSPKKGSSSVLTIIKILVTATLLYLLFRKADFSEILSLLSKTNWVLYGIVYLNFFIGLVLTSKRWQILLKEVGVNIKQSKLFKYNLTGSFFNILLPTSIGGDVVRTISAAKYSQKHAPKTVFATFFDRVVGLTALMFFVLFFIWFQPASSNTYNTIISLSSLLFILGLFFFISPCSDNITQKISDIIPDFKFKKYRLKDFVLLKKNYNSKYSPIIQGIALSLGFHFLGCLNQWLLFKAIGTDIPFSYILATTPLQRLVTLIPISLGGIGLKETTLLALLSQAGVSANEIAAQSMLGYSMSILLIIPIGLQLLLGEFRNRNTE
jgi:glycosyltransferase 2 family protein